MAFRIEKPSSIALPLVGVSSLRWCVGEKVCVCMSCVCECKFSSSSELPIGSVNA